MAQILETRAGKTILAETNGLAEYLAKTKGRVPGLGAEVSLTYAGNTLQVGSGMLVYTGVKAVNTDTYETTITPTIAGTQTLYVTATMNGVFDTLVFLVTPTSAGSINSKTVNLLGTNEVVSFDIGTVLNGTSGIISVTTTCPLAEYLPSQLAKYLPLAGGTMSGAINMNNNFIYLRTGVSIHSPSGGRINLTGNVYTDGLVTQGSNISTVGGKVYANAFGIQPPDGSQSTSAITWRDANSMNFLKDVYGKEFNMTSLINTGPSTFGGGSTFNGSSTFNSNVLIAANLNITGSTAMKSLTSQGSPITSGGGKMFSNSYGIQPPDGSVSTSAITWRDVNSMNFLKHVYMGGKTLYMESGNIDTGNGDIDTGTGSVSTSDLEVSNSINTKDLNVTNKVTTKDLNVTGVSVLKNTNLTGILNMDVPNFGGFVQKNDATAWTDSAEYLRILHANGNSQFKLGKDATNPTFSQTKGYLNWYAGDGTLLISLRPGTSTSHGVVHETQAGAKKLAYVDPSLNSAILTSNQILLENIETQQEMAFSTPTIDFKTINTLEVQKQTIIEQNAILEQDIIAIEQELEEISDERVIR